MKTTKLAALAACAAMLWADAAMAQTVDLQGCPPDRSQVGYLLMGRKELARSPKGTTAYAPTGVTFFGDPVLGIFQDSTNTSWLHIRLSRPGAVYFSAMSRKYAPVAERNSCGAGYEGCYMKLKPDNRMYSMHSFDFSNFSGRLEGDGEPDGPYLICFYN